MIYARISQLDLWIAGSPEFNLVNIISPFRNAISRFVSKAVHKCLAFENEAHSRFEGNQEGGQRPSGVELDAEGRLDPKSVGTVRGKYNKMAKERREALGDALDQPKSVFATLSADGEGVRDEMEGSFPAIIGLLSGVFDPFMGPYIAFERRNLDDLISAASRTPSAADDDIDRDRKLPVFSSSVNIFVYIKNSVQRCTKLTTGQTFFDLHEEFKSCLRCEHNGAGGCPFMCKCEKLIESTMIHGSSRSLSVQL